MTNRLLFEVSDEGVDNCLQGSDGRKIHEQSNKAMDVAILDTEVDVQKQDKLFARALPINLKQRVAVTPNNGG
jgi:hypothetical protein